MKKKKHAVKNPDSSEKDLISEINDIVMRKAEDSLIKIDERTVHMKQKVREYVRSHPERSALVALGIGALIGSGLSSIIREKIDEYGGEK